MLLEELVYPCVPLVRMALWTVLVWVLLFWMRHVLLIAGLLVLTVIDVMTGAAYEAEEEDEAFREE